MDKVIDFVHARKLRPTWLVYSEGIEHGGEFMAVLCAVNRYGRGSENRNLPPVELHGQVIRNLSADGYNDTARLLQIDNVEDSLQ